MANINLKGKLLLPFCGLKRSPTFSNTFLKGLYWWNFRIAAFLHKIMISKLCIQDPFIELDVSNVSWLEMHEWNTQMSSH